MTNSCTNWNYTKFEFDKILEQLSYFALTEECKKSILSTKVFTDFNLIERNYSILKDLINYLKYEENKVEIFKIFDIKEYLNELKKGIIPDAKKIYRICYNIRLYFTLQTRIDKEKYKNLIQIFTIIHNIDSFYKDVLKYIDEDGNIDSNISKTLKEIREEIVHIETKIKKGVDDFFYNAKKNDYVIDNIISFRDNLPCVGIKVSAKNKVNGIVIDYSTSGQTAFVVPAVVVELNNELVIAHEKEREEIRRILKEYSELIRAYIVDIEIIAEELIKFDLFFAKAKFAITNELTIPILSKDRLIRIKNGRHPFLKEKAVPLDIEIGADFNTLIITGPNTGGKTVLLKTVGLFILMNQCSLGVKADERSSFYVFENMFVDIGDEQSIEASLSTFSAHIKNIIDIITNINENSLILIDELGTGTDPMEGEALAISIIEKILEANCLTLVTTHFNALKMLASKYKNIQNGAMEFDNANLRPTYRLITGLPGRSYALEISERLGLNKNIIEKARSLIDKKFLDIDILLKEIMIEKRNYEEKMIELEKQLKIINEEREKLSILEKEMKEREKELKKIIKDQKFDFLIEIRKEFENIVENIKKNIASKESIIEGKNFIERIKNEIEEKEEKDNLIEVKNDINIGDRVLIISKDIEGIVVARSNKENELIVQAGIVKLPINIMDLKKIEDKKVNSKPVITFKPESKALTLDLRGCRCEEAEKKLEKFIEQSIASQTYTIRIIHGMGTGALKNFIHTYLKSSPFIVSFNYEENLNKGKNYGVTIAHLK